MKTPRSLAVLTIAALIAPFPLEVLAQETKTSTPASPPTSTPAPPPAPAPASKDSKEKAAAAPAAEAKFTASQLEQMAAPIALYPDSLLMQILMASTYPLEVVEAARWLEAHPELKDEKKIDEALKKEEWDPSVKSIVKFPDILKKMNKNLDWTRDIGDAFLGQQAELLDGVQRLRGKAHEAGNLKSGKEQTVTVQEDKTIIIQQANPEVIYVPTYNPTVVYGPYWPPPVYYPSMYYYPPGAAMFAFSVGFMWGAAMWGGCSWGWGHSNVNVNVNNYNNFNRNTNINGGNNINNGNINGGRGDASPKGDRGGGGGNQVNPNNKGGAGGGNQSWSHNPEHRKGVNYKDNKTAQQFGGNGANPRVSQSDARGFNQGGGRPSTGNSAGGAGGTGARPSTGNRAGGAGGTGARPSTGNVGSSSRPSTSNRSSSAFSGSRNSSFDRAASSRGMSSRSGGGGARAGGGGGGRRR